MTTLFRELDTVVLIKDLPEAGLRTDDLGAVVQVYGDQALEVEFLTASGRTEALLTLPTTDVRAVRDNELLAVRTSPRGRGAVELTFGTNMTDQTSELRDIQVNHVGAIRRNASGHPYLEAETSAGVAAFWGYGEETSNIKAMQAAILPVAVRCQVRIPKQSGRHAIWVPWSSPLFVAPVSRGPSAVTEIFDAEAARDELSRLGRVLGSVLDRIEGTPSTEGLVPRILRVSKAGRIPRRVSALMIFVAELRNSAEHDREPFTDLQASAGRTAWRAITAWLDAAKPEA